ncbi:unnamed protein product [Ceratitis capitata]|uniref:(Mediterranean fruit fly) hypothetical protein n=1 Tax=Ceratitis capitata TaxID=7213 RepID=A0A811UXI5_CERCA|nr:unnamed protein product [Ceratitis capitata]
MDFQETLSLTITVLASFLIVIIIILLGWYIIWKALLSKFSLLRELLGVGNGDQPADNQPQIRAKKVRRD